MNKYKVKKALLLCASHNDLGLVRALRKLGYYIIVLGNVPGLIGEVLCDEYIQMDYSDKEAVLELAKNRNIEAIVQCCNDYGVYTAAYVAEKLGLPGYDSYETTLLLHNKDRFKAFAAENGIISPHSEYFIDIDKALAYLEKVEYPVIVKPVDCSAGNGISRVNSYIAAIEAVSLAFQKSREKRIIVEPFIAGTQHGFCTFLLAGKVVAVCSNNEYSIINPYRVEIDTYPADEYEAASSILIPEIEMIAKKLALKDGIFHLQYIVSDGKPYIIEVMRRVLGNMYSVPANMLSGVDWDYWETRAKCGLDCSAFPQQVRQEGCFAYKTILASKNGIIRDISIPTEYNKYMFDKCLIMKTGDAVNRFESQPIGFLFFMFPSVEVMKEVLIAGYRNDLVTVE